MLYVGQLVFMVNTEDGWFLEGENICDIDAFLTLLSVLSTPTIKMNCDAASEIQRLRWIVVRRLLSLLEYKPGNSEIIKQN